MDVYLNGRMLGYDQAHVAHDDAGLQHAVGLFETMAAHHGRVFRLDAHLDRLLQSSRELGLAHGLDHDKLRQAVEQTLTHNQLDQARVRLTVTPGSVSLLRPATSQPVSGTKDESDNQPEPTLLAVATGPISYDQDYFDQGISVQIAPPVANPFDTTSGHKTIAYWSHLRLLRQAAFVGAGEAILLNITNHLASGAVSNLFLVKDNTLLTPFARGEEVNAALPAPVLPGITRAAVIELAPAQDLKVERRMLSVEDLLDADEVFLTNSSWNLLPVTRVEKEQIGTGRIGPVAAALRSALLDLIEQETVATK